MEVVQSTTLTNCILSESGCQETGLEFDDCQLLSHGSHLYSIINEGGETVDVS